MPNLYLLLLVQQLISASTHLVTRSVAETTDPFTIVLLRTGLAVVGFVVWLAPQWKTLPRVEKADAGALLALGFSNVMMNQVLFTVGLRYTTAPNAALMYALTPTFVLVICRFAYNERSTPTKLAGVALAFIGTVIVLLERGLELDSSYFWGNVAEFFAAFSWALYSVIGREMSVKYGAAYSTALGMVTGLLWFLPVYPFLPVSAPFEALSGSVWWQIVYLALVATCLKYFLWYYALGKLPTTRVAVFSNLQPVLVTVLNILIFQILPSWIFVAGGIVVLCGVWLTQTAVGSE